MVNVTLKIERLREELENLITLEGLNHQKVLKLSQILDEYILIHYLKQV